MKRCPECRRDYYDETLLYCLDDGNALLDGPASHDEPATAILSDRAASAGGQLDESVTRAQVHTTDQTAALPSNEDAVGARVNRRRFAQPVIIGLALALIAGSAFAYYKYAVRAAIVSFEGATITRVTDSGELISAVISPDGKWLVYGFYISGLQESIWLQQVGVAGSGVEIVKAAEISVSGIAFSPDSKYVYYSAKDKSDGWVTGALYQIPVIGGTAKKLLTSIDSKIAFSPDGKRFAYYYFAPGKDQATGSEWRLMIANDDGSGQRQLTARGGNEALEDPAWSPDGKSIVSVLGTIEPRVRSLVTISPETGEIIPFHTGKFQTLDDPVWLADGKSVLVLAKEKTTEQKKIWQISYPSGEARKVSAATNTPGTYYLGLSLSSDSSILATTQYTDTSSLWIAATSEPTAATQLKLGSDMVGNPAWTPDGKIVFSKSNGDAKELNVTDPQGGAPKQLTSAGGENGSPDVTPDGRYIVFTSDRGGNYQLWRIDMNGDNPKQLTTNGKNSEASISPDGREVYYTCDLNMVNMICKVPIDGGEPVQVTTTPSDTPRISADGKWILCFFKEKENERGKVAIIPAGGGAPVKTFPIPASLGLFPRWMPDDRAFFYTSSKAYVDNVWVQSIDGGPPKQYTNFTSQYLPWVDFSRDGKIVYRRGSSVADVILISGFTQ